MNSKRSPFHVKRYGHDDGLRSSSVSASVECGTIPAAGASAAGGSSACTMPAGHSTRTTSAAARLPRPKTTSSPGRRRPGARGFDLLPQAARAQLDLEPTALRLLTLPARRIRSDGCRLPPSFLSAISRPRSGPPGVRSTRSVSPSPSTSPRHPGRARDRRERQHHPHRDAPGRRSAAAGVAHLRQHRSRGGDDVEAPVAVEIDELRRAHVLEAVDRRRREASPVAGGEHGHRARPRRQGW